MTTPAIRLIKTHVVTCYSCGAWLGRCPQWCSEGDKGDFCTKCGGTAVRVRDGRPFGPRSKDWDVWHADYLWLMDGLDDLSDPLAKEVLAMVVLR